MRDLLHKLFRRDGRNLKRFVLANSAISFALFYILEKAWGAKYGLVDTFYWLGATVTTTGYGDITPTIWITKIIAVWLMVSSLVAFGIGIALLGAHFVVNPFEDEMVDDTDDILVMEGVILQGVNDLRDRILGLDPLLPPDSVEELNGLPTNYSQKDI